MICKWATDCNRCGTRVEEEDEIYFAKDHFGDREKICYTCAFMDGLLCDCGNMKKQDYAMCWDCKREKDEADGLVCECGRRKKADHMTCYTCKIEQDRESGLVCECGKYKK